MGRKGYDTDVTDAEWAILEPIVRREGTMGRPVKLDLREIVNAAQFVMVLEREARRKAA